MRATDHRYTGEISRFDLAVRMIGHEARTGTIRYCTGFSEDRIRKIYGTYFKSESESSVRRRRGKSPTQIAPYINSSLRQSEATILACLFLYCGAISLDAKSNTALARRLEPVELGNCLCDAYETYRCIHPEPGLCFEKTWGLYNALVKRQELFFAECADCDGLYVQDRYALDYRHCPFCDLKQGATDA